MPVGGSSSAPTVGVIVAWTICPTTSATTYKVQAREGSGGTVAVGRTVGNSDSTVMARFPSTITVMEIAA